MKLPRYFVIGDIHGAFRALEQCFTRAAFNTERDNLICLGDVCDSWPEVDKVIERLLGIKNCVLLAGNHDRWALDWFITKDAPSVWISQGGDATIKSYEGKIIPEDHVNFLSKARPYYISDNKLFVHGGIIPGMPLEDQSMDIFMWDRSLVSSAMILQSSGRERNMTGYDEVYVGHTPTLRYGERSPVRACEIYMMDTGAGWPDGVLSMMEIESKDTYLSDNVSQLYRGVKGRA